MVVRFELLAARTWSLPTFSQKEEKVEITMPINQRVVNQGNTQMVMQFSGEFEPMRNVRKANAWNTADGDVKFRQGNAKYRNKK